MILLIFVYGIIIGSFLNVCIYRIPRREGIVYPPSHCPVCNYKLKWYDNIPLLSYRILRGRCRSCDAPISIQYPLVELLNGIIYIILYYHFNFTIDFVFFALISSVLIVITFIDLMNMLIPDVLIIILVMLEILHKLSLYFLKGITVNLWDSFLGLFVSGFLFLLIVIVSRGGMGDGDITLIASIGFILGLKSILLTILLSFIIGAIISLFLLLTRIKTKKDPIAFGPFIVLSFFIVLLYGPSIINWYFSLIYR